MRKRKEEMTNTPENKPESNGDGKSDAIASPVYQTADGLEMKLLERMMKKFHKPLIDAKVSVSMQFWESPEGAPMVKVRGCEVFGKVKILTADNRAAGSPDVRLIVDRSKWNNATPFEQEAALDSLLMQFEVCTAEESGEILRDKAGHPKLKKRKPDLVLEGYSRVAEDHGKSSIECKQFAAVSGTFAQLKLFDDVAEMASVG